MSAFPNDTDADNYVATDLGNKSAGQLKSFVERIERLNDDRDAILADRKEVYAELKGSGFDPKIVRKLITIRRMDKAKRQEEEALLEMYAAAVGEG